MDLRENNMPAGPANAKRILQEVICIYTGNFMYCDWECSRWCMKRNADLSGRGCMDVLQDVARRWKQNGERKAGP